MGVGRTRYDMRGSAWGKKGVRQKESEREKKREKGTTAGEKERKVLQLGKKSREEEAGIDRAGQAGTGLSVANLAQPRKRVAAGRAASIICSGVRAKVPAHTRA